MNSCWFVSQSTTSLIVFEDDWCFSNDFCSIYTCHESRRFSESKRVWEIQKQKQQYIGNYVRQWEICCFVISFPLHEIHSSEENKQMFLLSRLWYWNNYADHSLSIRLILLEIEFNQSLDTGDPSLTVLT